MRFPDLWRGESRLFPSRLFRDDFTRLFDRMAEEVFGRPVHGRQTTGGELTLVPDVDVIERDDSYLIKVELPGVTAENVSVNLAGNSLQIRGEKSAEMEKEGGNYYICERGYGSFLRTIPLPSTVEEGKIEAKLDNGILEVVCPKSETTKPRRIEVHSETAGAKHLAEKTTYAGKSDKPRAREERERERS